jgi:hypothetical protein
VTSTTYLMCGKWQVGSSWSWKLVFLAGRTTTKESEFGTDTSSEIESRKVT